MNLICILFGHNFKPIVVKQEKTYEGDKVEKAKWSRIVVCPRCGKEIEQESSDDQGQ